MRPVLPAGPRSDRRAERGAGEGGAGTPNSASVESLWRVLNRLCGEAEAQAAALLRACDNSGPDAPYTQLSADVLRSTLQRIRRLAVVIAVRKSAVDGEARMAMATWERARVHSAPVLAQVEAVACAPETWPAVEVARWVARLSATDPLARYRSPKGHIDLTDRVITGRSTADVIRDSVQTGQLIDPHRVAQVIAALDLRARDLADAGLERAQLVDVDGCDAFLDGANLDNAVLSEVRLSRASLCEARLNGVVARDCDFEQVYGLSGQWRGATFVRCSFVGATLTDLAADGALFLECDFRGVDFSARARTGNAAVTLRGARFDRCDLRLSDWDGRSVTGASFTDCKFHGVSGMPSEVDGVDVRRPDLSPNGDGSWIGDLSAVIARWQQPTRRRGTTAPMEGGGMR